MEKTFLELLRVHDQDYKREMEGYRNPKGFALTRAREIVLQLDEQRGSIVQLAESHLPAIGVVQIAFVRARALLRRGGRSARRDFSRGHRTHELSD